MGGTFATKKKLLARVKGWSKVRTLMGISDTERVHFSGSASALLAFGFAARFALLALHEFINLPAMCIYVS